MKKEKIWLSLSSLSTMIFAVVFMSLPQKVSACSYSEYGSSNYSQYLGSVCMTAATFCPKGYVMAEGQLLSVSNNYALFALLDTKFGGDGRTTFGLPDLRGRSPASTGYAPEKTVYLGSKFGSEYSTMTAAMMPNHSHEATLNNGASVTGLVELDVTASAKIATSVAVNVSDTPVSNVVLGPVKQGVTGINVYSAPNTIADITIGPDDAVTGEAKGILTLTNSETTFSVSGGGKKIPVAAPRLALNFCISVNGVFPPRN